MPGRPRFPREWTWQGGHRVAVTIGVPFEAFINQSQFSYIGTLLFPVMWDMERTGR